MSTHVPGFSHFSGLWHHFVTAKLATTSIRVHPSHARFPGSLYCKTRPRTIIILCFVSQTHPFCVPIQLGYKEYSQIGMPGKQPSISFLF